MSNPETTETASDLHVSASVCVVGVLAEALALHREGAAIVASYTEGRLTLMEYSCSCGWRERSNWADGSTHPAHVASVVAALPNIAIVPVETGEFFEGADGTQTQVWDGPLQTVQTWPEANEIILRDDFEHSVPVADVARQGAIFIAAARAAGGPV